MHHHPPTHPPAPPTCARSDVTTLTIHTGTLVSTLLMFLFCVDIIVSFFVGYFDDSGALVTDLSKVALNYTRWAFGWDGVCVWGGEWSGHRVALGSYLGRGLVA